MASDENGDTPNRATVALVAEKLDGLKELTKAGFVDVQRQLDVLVTVPRELVELRSKQAEMERRVRRIERDDERHAEWRRGPMLAGCLAVLGVVINLIIAYH